MRTHWTEDETEVLVFLVQQKRFLCFTWERISTYINETVTPEHCRQHWNWICKKDPTIRDERSRTLDLFAIVGLLRQYRQPTDTDKRGWTAADDAQLCAYREVGLNKKEIADMKDRDKHCRKPLPNSDWRDISNRVFRRTKTEDALRKRFSSFLDYRTGCQRGPWSERETGLLVALCEYDPEDIDWKFVSKTIETRTVAQCKIKWKSTTK